MQRIYDFDSVYNFRDFGGYPTKDGERVKSGLLWRSAHLNKAADDVHQLLLDKDLRLLVDMRQEQERARQPNLLPAKDDLTILEFQTPDGLKGNALAPHEMFLKEALFTAGDARRYMLSAYSARINSPAFQALASRTLNHMVEEGGAVLIHCAAGKDRTGTLAALILTLLGVERDLVYEDYMLTNKAVNIEAFLKPAAIKMSKKFDRSVSPDALRPMFGVEADYLSAAFEKIGDVNAYAAGPLGISSKALKSLQAAFTADR